MSQSYRGISPRSECYLIHDCPLEIENCNQIDFISEAQQFGWFKGEGSSPCSYTKLDSVQFIRKETGSIKVPYALTELRGVNYLVFQNPSGGSPTSGFDGKRYYCYVLDKLYVNQNTTKILFAIDYFQTYLFDWKFKTCLIERETVDSDYIGEHRLDEGLTGLGDVYTPLPVDGTGIFNSNDVSVIILSTMYPEYEDGKWNVYSVKYGNTIGGVYNGCHVEVCATPAEANAFIQRLGNAGYSDAIVGMYMSPLASKGSKNTNAFDRMAGTTSAHVTIQNTYSGVFTSRGNRTYRPANNKLKMFPYQCLHVATNGESQDFDLTQFADPSHPQFTEVGLNGGVFSAIMMPVNYAGETGESFLRQMNLGTFPTCSWSNDAYQALVANKVRAGMFSAISGFSEVNYKDDKNIAGQILKTANNLYQGGKVLGSELITGRVNGLEVEFGEHAKDTERLKGEDAAIGYREKYGLTETTSAYLQARDVAKTGFQNYVRMSTELSDIYPPDFHGSVNTDVAYAYGQAKGWNRPKFFNRHIDADTAKRIDQYLTWYGYKVSKMGLPNLRSRKLFNYVQMTECHIAKKPGAIMEKDAEEQVKSLFMSGLRIWHYNTNRGLADFNIVNADENPIDHNESSKARDYNN